MIIRPPSETPTPPPLPAPTTPTKLPSSGVAFLLNLLGVLSLFGGIAGILLGSPFIGGIGGLFFVCAIGLAAVITEVRALRDDMRNR